MTTLLATSPSGVDRGLMVYPGEQAGTTRLAITTYPGHTPVNVIGAVNMDASTTGQLRDALIDLTGGEMPASARDAVLRIIDFANHLNKGWTLIASRDGQRMTATIHETRAEDELAEGYAQLADIQQRIESLQSHLDSLDDEPRDADAFNDLKDALADLSYEAESVERALTRLQRKEARQCALPTP